jgi:hypothetical protein
MLTTCNEELGLNPAFFIGGWSIPESICTKIVENFNKNRSLIQTRDGFRNYNVLTNVFLDEKIDLEYQKYLKDVLTCYKKQYPHCYENTEEWDLDKIYNIQHYLPGKSYYKWHCEYYGPQKNKKTRHLAFMTYLNTVSDGGETKFFYQNVKIKPKTGLTMIWPVQWTHMHKGFPAKFEDKYIATGWFSFLTKE